MVIGDNLLARAGALLAPKLPQKRAMVITDRTVAALHLQTLMDGLAETAIAASSIVVKGGEASKSMDTYLDVVDQLLEARVERRTAVIALGGGVVGDLAGFAAATTLRGLPFIQIPTTLLSQVDSSVGGKTGVNTRRGKNLVGAFYQPKVVLADTATLATLPPRELKAGYAEIAKAGLIGDAALFAWCEMHGQSIVSGDREAQAEAIKRACAFKAAVVGDDEREEKPNDGRALLNLGHTFGHALEAEYGYDGGLLHGEGVAVGLGLAFKLSARLGLCPPADAERVIAHISAVGLPADLSMLNRRFSAETLIGHMQRDKKMRDGSAAFRAGAGDRPGIHQRRGAGGRGHRPAARGRLRCVGAMTAEREWARVSALRDLTEPTDRIGFDETAESGTSRGVRQTLQPGPVVPVVQPATRGGVGSLRPPFRPSWCRATGRGIERKRSSRCLASNCFGLGSLRRSSEAGLALSAARRPRRQASSARTRDRRGRRTIHRYGVCRRRPCLPRRNRHKRPAR